MLSLNNQPTHLQRLMFSGFALLVAGLYDFFIWDNQQGIGFLLFVCIYLLGFLLLIAYLKKIRQKWALLLIIPILVLSIDAVVFNNMFVRNFGLFFVAVFLVLFSLLVTLETDKHSFGFLNIQFVRSWVVIPFLKQISNVFYDLTSRSENKKNILAKILLGILIAVPLILFFGALFAKADMIFADYIEKFFTFDIEEMTMWRLFRTVFLWIVGSGFFYIIIARDHATEIKERFAFKIDAIIVATVLTILNALFLIFVFIQFKYLFGSYDYVINNKIIFSEYARQGFAQLIAVSIFSSFVFLAVYRLFSKHSMPVFLKVLNILFVVQVGIIAASALKRMNLYHDAYGYTALRLYVEWFIYFIFVLIALGIINLIFKLQFRVLIYSGLALGVIALTIVCSVNVDYMIANKNIDRFMYYDKELDVDYLENLSLDIVPVFFKNSFNVKLFEEKFLEQRKNGKLKCTGGEGGSCSDETVRYILYKQIRDLESHDSQLEFNLGVFNARQLLSTLKSPNVN
jgi:hypothetical protein